MENILQEVSYFETKNDKTMGDGGVISAGQKVETLLNNNTSKHRGKSLYVTVDEAPIRKIFWEYPDELIHLYDDSIAMGQKDYEWRKKAISGNWIEF